MQRSDPPPASPNRSPTSTGDADSPSEEPADAGVDLPLDVVFDLLSNERRRRVLRYLQETPETTLGDLAEHVASIEEEKPVAELSSSERKGVYIVLYQCHLPRMDDAGVIDFDQHRKTVEVGEAFEQLRPYLSTGGSEEETRSWSEYFVGVTALGAGALGVQSALFPAVWLSSLIVGTVLAIVGMVSVERLHRNGRLAL